MLNFAPSSIRNVESVNSWQVPTRGKGGNLKNKIALVHSLAHIESVSMWTCFAVPILTHSSQVAIDLSWDMIARFGRDPSVFPVDFYDDWVRVAADESRHFLIWDARLLELGSFYGELPTHNALWASAMKTSHDILARLAVEHMVLEARGLDVCPRLVLFFPFCSYGAVRNGKSLKGGAAFFTKHSVIAAL